MPGGEIDGYNIDTDEYIVQAQVAEPEGIHFQQRRTHQKQGRDEAMNNAQHRTGDANIVSFAGEEVFFHWTTQKYDASLNRIPCQPIFLQLCCVQDNNVYEMAA